MGKVLVTDTHLSAIAAAIRAKNGTQTTYKPADMAAAIAAIPSGGAAVLETLTVTENGTYTPGTGVDGFSSVVVNVSGGGGSLPDTYQKVEYLESSDGNAAIPLGVTITTALKIQLDFQLTSMNNVGIYCGAQGLALGHMNSNQIFATNSGGYQGSSTTIGIGRHQITWNKTSINSVSFELDGAAAVSLLLSYSSSYDLNSYVMSGYPANSGIGMIGRLYGAKVYDFDQVIVRNLIPCYDKSTQTPGLYDLARGAFYTNAGTGTLTVGPDVE